MKDFILYLSGAVIAFGGVVVLVKVCYASIVGTNKLEKKLEQLEKEHAEIHKIQSEMNIRAQHEKLLKDK